MSRQKTRKSEPSLPPLWKHQGQTLSLLEREPRVLDASDPGTGKTRAAIEAFHRRRTKDGKALLVLAPKTLLQTAWGNDIEAFAPDLDYSVAYAENRAEAFAAEADIYITNTDAVTWLAKQNKKFFQRFDSLVIDELSAYKHRTSGRSRAINAIRKHFAYREGLTGTPNPNSVTELWHQILLLDDGQRLGTSFFHFRNAVCVPEQTGPRPQHLSWVDRPGAEEAVAKLLSDITIRHQFDECMDIPPNHVQTVTYYPSKRLLALYRELEDNAILELERDTVTAIHAAALRNKLLQVASGAVYSANDNYTVLDPGRYELVLDLVEQRRHSLVFFNWRHQREQLEAHATKRGIVYATIDGTVPTARRAQIVEAYQAGFFQTLFIHPQTGAHGLTLTRGTATILVSPIYQADYFKQLIHRIHRGGQTQRTETILIEAEGTVERIVYERLSGKNTRMINFLDVLRDSKLGRQ